MKIQWKDGNIKTIKDYYKINWSLYFKIDQNSKTGLTTLEGIPVGRISSIEALELNRIGWILTFSGERWLVHRIVTILMHKENLGNFIVDHLDGNPYNNKPENLRATTQKINTRNRRKQSNNVSGTTGIGQYTINNIEYVIATVKIQGKSKSKAFNILKLGLENATNLAYTWRVEQLKFLGDFTERHGK